MSREEWRRSRQGKKVRRRCCVIGDRGEAGLRPDQAIEEAVWSGLGTVTKRRRWRPSAPEDWRRINARRLRRLPAGQRCCILTLHHHWGDRRPGSSLCRRDLVLPRQRSNEGRFPGLSVNPRPTLQSQRSQTTRAAVAHRGSGLRNGDDTGQVRARSRPDGPVAAAIPAIRTKAVMPTATAPMTEKMICQVSDGMVCFTRPCVAW